MQKAFGINEFGQADLPVKISNVQISRVTTYSVLLQQGKVFELHALPF